MASDSQPPSKSTVHYCTDVAEFLRILHRPGDVFELRILNCPERAGGSFVSTAAGWFNDCATAAKEIERIGQLRPPAVYVTINPVFPALLARAVNRLMPKAKSTTTDVDILSRQWLFIDIDAKRPAGVSSTDAELAEAVSVSDAIRTAMYADGWPEPLQGMSGNGRYLLWRVELANDAETTELIKGVLHGLAHRFNSKGAEVDCSTFNAARIIKVLGTVARKGDELVGVAGVDDRPHRQSWFIKPDGPLGIVTADQLQLLVDVIKPELEKQPKRSNGNPSTPVDVIERARQYLAKVPSAIAGQKGHNQLLSAASRLVIGFDLSQDVALRLLTEEYNPRCDPPWTEKELRHKVSEAAKLPGDRGSLLRNRPERINAVNNRDADRVPGPDDSWPEPESIERPSVPVFPVEVLPEPLRSWVSATAEACQVPSDLPGLLSMAACAGAVARRVEILAGRGWFEPINLYVAVVMEPGNRKSAVFSSALRPLRVIERELIKLAKPDIAKQASERRMKEKQLDTAEKKGATGDLAACSEAGRLAEELAVEPVESEPKLLLDDATAESVEMQLAAQGGRLIVAGCEGGLFDIMAGRYSAGNGNLDVFLKGHAGDDLRVDRVTRGSVVVDRCCLTLAYAVQPEVIRGLAERPSFRGRGLIGRFLYAVPETRLGKRRVNPDPVSDAVAGAYEVLVRRLAAIPEAGDGRPALLRLSPGASSCFGDWQREVEGWLGDEGRLAELRDWGGKLCGLTARLAAVLHVIEHDEPEPWRVPVRVGAIESAIELGRYAVSHAEAVIGLMSGADGPADDALYVLRWLRERGLSELTRRDVAQHGRSRFDGAPDRLEDAIELLLDRGWIRPLATGAPGRPGRPPSPRFSVHPRLCVGRSASAPVVEPVVLGPSARVRGVVS